MSLWIIQGSTFSVRAPSYDKAIVQSLLGILPSSVAPQRSIQITFLVVHFLALESVDGG